jgi:hypothetical protein
MKYEIPNETLKKCHPRCWKLLHYLVKHSVYQDDDWFFDDYVATICLSVHEKKHIVYALLIALQMDGFLTLGVDGESDDFEYILVTLNMAFIFQ